MFDRDAVTDQIREFISDGSVSRDIPEDLNLFDNELFDSVKVVNLVLSVESTFSLSLDFEDLTEENLESIGAIVDLIESKNVG